MGVVRGIKMLAKASLGAQIPLPPAKLRGKLTVEEALTRRRSERDFTSETLSLEQIAQLLWAAAGLTSKDGGRTSPSAGARYPLEVYLACEQGFYHYHTPTHSLIKISTDDLRPALASAAYGQSFVAEAAISIIFTAIYERTTSRYGERGYVMSILTWATRRKTCIFRRMPYSLAPCRWGLSTTTPWQRC